MEVILNQDVKSLGKKGEKVCLYTHFYVREDAVELLGFYTEAELEA